MNSKNRLIDALNHKNTDKIPIDFGGTPVSGMHVSCVAALRDYYHLEKKPVKVIESFQFLGEIDDQLKEIIGIDVQGVASENTFFGFANDNWKQWQMDNSLEVLVPGDFNITIDERGDKYIYPEGDLSVPPSGKMPYEGYYFDAIIRQEEIDDDNLNPEDNLEEFKVFGEKELQYFNNEVHAAYNTNKGVIANFGGSGIGDIALVPATFLKHPKGIRDIEQWYISTITRQDYLHTVFEKQTDIVLKNFENINSQMGDKIDAIFICGTDFGTQTSTFCSPNTFKELYMPYYKKMNSWIHTNTNWKTFKHSCGAVETFMDLFIDSGFDIINPVQCSANGMDAINLKDKYGDKLVFWGGGIDTQWVLPFGKPEEVRQQVLKRCEIFSKDGGFVFNAIHNIQANTPVENIVAMIDAVHEFNK